MERNSSNIAFIFRIASVHTIAYFFAGIFAIVFMNYKEHYVSQSLSLLMRPVDSPWVAIGPSLQIVRGVIIALILLPFKNIIVLERYGFLKMAWLMLGLSFISTIGPAPGSFEGYIYTILPLQYHLLGIPETLLYIGLLSLILWIWYRQEKPLFRIVAVVIVSLIALMSGMGLLKAFGILKV